MSANGGSITDRMVGAAFLDVDTFEEVEHDENATGQAAMVVAMVAVAEAIGSSGEGPFLAIGAAVSALVAWVAYSALHILF